MQHFSSDGVDIAYLDNGAGDPVLLVHGFASNANINWAATSWSLTLERAERRVIALDNRGHGESAKLYEVADYAESLMARDAANLLRHLGISRADVIGYSMGGRIGAFLALQEPALVRSLVIGGMGLRLVEGMEGGTAIADALEQGPDTIIGNATARGYREFAVRTRSDLKALAACMRGGRETISAGRLAGMRVPVLVAVGENDDVAGSGKALAELIPGAEFLLIPRRDHMTATGDRVFKDGVLDFLARRP